MHPATRVAEGELAAIDIPIERDLFLRSLLRELAGTLQDVIGVEEASGFVSIVGQRIGEWLGDEYRKALGVRELSAGQVPAVLVDLKKRIQGDFSVESIDQDKIVLVNRACPFGDKSARSSLLVHDDVQRVRYRHIGKPGLCQGRAARDDCPR